MNTHDPNLDARSIAWYGRFSGRAASAVMAIAAMALLGWLLHARDLASVLPDQATVKVNTALGLLAVGAGLLLVSSPSPGRRRAARLLGLVALAIGLVSLVQWSLGIDLGIDQLLAHDPDGGPHPGRPAPNSALALAFAGAALWSIDIRVGRVWPSNTLALAAGVLGLFAAIGYASDVPQLYGVGQLSHMAAPSAVSYILLGAGIPAARPDRGAMRLLSLDSPGGALARRLVPAVIGIPTVLAFLREEGQRLGVFGPEVGTLVLVSAVIGAMSVLVWRFAGTLDRADGRRRSAVEDLREANERFAGAFDNASVGMALVDPDGSFVQVNDELCRIVGRPRDRLVELGFPDLTHPDDLDHDVARFRRALAGEMDSYETEKRYVHANGRTVPILLTVSVVRDAERQPLYLVATMQDIGERKQAEAALHLQAEVASNVSAGICLVRSADAEIVYANGTYERMFGFGPGEMLGRTVPLPQGFDRDELKRELGETIARSGRWSGEVMHARQDGSALWCHSAVSRFEHPDHGVVSVIVETDVSERHEAAERLARERRQLLEAQSVAKLGSWELDLRTTEVSWSEQQFRVYGLDPSDAPPSLDEYHELVHPDDRQRVRDRAGSIAPDEQSYEYEYRVVRPDRDEAILHVRASVLEADDEGRAVRVGGTSQDVTEQRSAEAALRDAERLFRGAFEDAPIGMALCDPTGRYMQANQALCDITGYERDQLLATTFQSITHPDDMHADAEGMKEMLEGEKASHTSDKRYMHANGHTVWVSAHVNLIRADDGSPRHFLVQVQDVTERKRYESRLQHMADHDPLTGLFNRRSFERELQSHVDRVSRYGAEGAAIVLDIDNFKYVNDTLGHNAGDELIVRVAHALRDRLRTSDVLARLGGDEFAVLLPKEDRAGAIRVANDLLDRIRQEETPGPVAGRGSRLTASMGVAMFGDEEGLTGEDVLMNADLSMYDAKEAGRDQAAMYRSDEHPQARMKGRITWAKRIRTALDDERFTLLAQPVHHLATGRVTQQELLLRMQDDTGDLIPPATFLYIAERLDLVQEIDRWVVGQAIDLLEAEREAGRERVLEVNLSGRSIGDPELLDLIEGRLAQGRISPSSLILEITETAAVADIPSARDFGARLADLGCRFALDDFGAGFGSFYYLKFLPFDFLKIDGEFVKNCASNPTDRLIIESVVNIARGLGKHTIAEFVGGDETAAALVRLGVDFGQGFHLGRPAPLERAFAAAPGEGSIGRPS